uniref:NADH dehydrogenase subunit 2 n=1 Tax=Pila globosa TaxID=759386 RepID=UPI0025A981CA|nr:NADH dehydrogenase subunit 2 [Pila globosa]WIW42436.1 NADH dehydrogenase subunit 2 [Pila globosa]
MLSMLPFGFLFLSVLVFGTLFSISSVHWLGIWAGLEMNLIGFVPILVYQKKISESESAVKYFIMQAIGSGLLIFGSLVGFGLEFSWGLSDNNTLDNVLSMSSLVLIIMSLILKMGAFPLHYWFPATMAGLSWISCMILVTWQKVAPIFLIGSFFSVHKVYWLALLLSIFGAGSSVVGGIGGVNQTQVRALLAYSSIGHLGWILFSVSYSELALMVYFYIYALVSLGMFLVLWYLDKKDMLNTKSMNQNHMYKVLIILTLLMSMGGLPPFIGFISKLMVIMSSVSYMFSLILIFLVMGSLISLFYYLGLFFSLYFSAEPFGLYFNKFLTINMLASLLFLFNLFGIFLLFLILSIYV